MGLTRTTYYQTALVDISEDADLSTAVDIRDMAIFGLIVPSNFDGTEIKYWVSHDNVTYYALYDGSNTLIADTITASTARDLPTELAPWAWLKIETTTDQATSDTELIVCCKG
jgi:tellurite resistance-related uncharacterized protein